MKVFVIACAVLSLLAFSPQAGAAGDYELVPCFFQNVTTQTYGSWAAETGADDWSISASCPSEVQFKVAGPDAQPGGDWRGYGFPAANSAANTIKSVSFDLLGSNGSDGGVEQAVFICSPTLCSSPIKPGGSNVVFASHHTFAAAALPPGANQVRLAGRCPIDVTCTPARALRLQNLDIVFAETVKPTIARSELPINPSLPALIETNGENAGAWQSSKLTPQVRFTVEASDGESGVQYVQFEFFRTDTVPPQLVGRSWANKQLCGTAQQYKIGVLCPHVLRDEMLIQPQGAINNFGIREGLNLMKAVAFDAAGNRSDPIVTWFLVDSIAPKVTITSPAGPQVHWRAAPKASVTWQNSEGEESSTESGLASARWTVRDATTGEVEPGYGGEEAGAVGTLIDVPLPGQGIWDVEVTTTDRAGNVSSPGAGTTTRIGVDSTVLGAPRIDPVSPVGTAEIATGLKIPFQPPDDAADAPSGICGYATSHDQDPVGQPGDADLGADARTVKLVGPFTEGANYLHLRAFTCAGVPGAVASVRIDVKTTTPLLTTSSPGPSGWYSEDYPLTAEIVGGDPSVDLISAVLDTNADVFKSGAQTTVPLIDGEHKLRVTARDGVGNISTLMTTVWIDVTPPEVSLAPRDPARPATANAVASDGASGISSAELQYRRVGTADWLSVAQPTRPKVGTASLAYSVPIPDADLPSGAYDLRGVAIDRAGHSASSPPGKTILTLPLRNMTTVTSGFTRVEKSKGGKRRTVSRDSVVVNLGRRATLTGRLSLGPESHAASPIEIVESGIGVAAHTVATVRTDARGRFRYEIAAGRSRRVTARFPGNDLYLPTEFTSKFLVRPRVTLRIRQAARGGGSRVSFAGRLVAPNAVAPSGGPRVRIEFDTSGSDKLISITTKADAAGRFAVARNFKRQASPIRFGVRAVVPWFEGWSYETGRSELKEFVVR